MRSGILKFVAAFALLAGAFTIVPVVSAAGPQTTSVTVVVPANGDGNGNPWVDSGFVLKAGVPVSVTATGNACIDPNPTYCGGPNGNGHPTDPTFLLSSAPSGSLIGQAGGGPFAIGAGPTTIAGSGPLLLAQNDSIGNLNNTGSFTVTISYTCYPGNGNGDANHYHCGPPGQA
jgi:hypothetical protein